MIASLKESLRSATLDRWWDLPAVCLLIAALLTTAHRLVVTGWTDHLDIVRTLTFLGTLAGLALGLSAFSPSRACLFALAYGLFAIPWQLGRTLTRISDAALWSERAIDLGLRLTNSFVQLAQQEPVEDPLLFVFLMAMFSWVLGAHAGYTLTRHAHPWRAVLPAGLGLLILHTYDPFLPTRAWYLALFLFFALLLLARLIYLRRRARWQRERVFLPAYAGRDFARITLQVTVLLVLVSWITPVLATAFSPAQIAWRDVTRPWISIRDRLGNVVAALREQFGVVYNAYGDSLLLDRGNELTDDVSLVVEVPPNAPTALRYYWRARIYDQYADGQWHTGLLSDTQRVTPQHFGLTFPQVDQSEDRRWTAVFTITTIPPISTLFVPAQPVSVSHSAQADVVRNPDGTVDLFALHASPPLHPGDAYRVRSSFNDVTVAQMRSAGTDYPAWVAARYLQLPSDLSPRVRELAHEITLDMETPYDAAAAITTYLRTYIRYSETISARRPTDLDPLEWFLFDVREGFCSYYASAEVIMLRSLGIPARLAVGFAEGDRESGRGIYMISQGGTGVWPEASELYLVRQRHAHAWPEVYFPGLGWVEFEPTASQLPLYRPLGDDESGIVDDLSPFYFDDGYERWHIRMEELLDAPVEAGQPSEPAEASDDRPPIVFWLFVFGLGLTLILVASVWRRRRWSVSSPLPALLQEGFRRFDLQPPAVLHRWIIHATLPLLARAYQEINHALTRLGAPPNPADTPAERASALERLLPEAAESARRLLAEYHDAAYGPRPGNLSVAQQAARSIRDLSWRTVIRRRVARK
jgi:transglutaminase-like putative cysteine protease